MKLYVTELNDLFHGSGSSLGLIPFEDWYNQYFHRCPLVYKGVETIFQYGQVASQ